MRKITLTLTIILTSACANNVYNYKPKTTNVSFPAIGEQTTASIGDKLLRKGTYQQHEALCVSQPMQFGLSYKLIPGAFQKTGDKKNKEYFAANGSSTDSGQIVPLGLAKTAKGVRIDKNKSQVCIITDVSIVFCKKTTHYEKCTTQTMGLSSFEQTLIYNGKIGNTLKIAYREFSNNAARPAFNNTVEYDLSTSNIITYQGAEIEVIDANNSKIVYRVITHFTE